MAGTSELFCVCEPNNDNVTYSESLGAHVDVVPVANCPPKH